MWKIVPCVANCPACDSELFKTKDRAFYHPDGDINADILSCNNDCPLQYSHMSASELGAFYNGSILDQIIYIKLSGVAHRVEVKYYKSIITIVKCRESHEKYNRNTVLEFPLLNFNYKDPKDIVEKVLTMLAFS